MTTPKSTEQRAAEKLAAERAEREEMFSFHPNIRAAASPLPRRSDGSSYTSPEGEGDGTGA